MSKPSPDEHTPQRGGDGDAFAHDGRLEPGDIDSFPYNPDASDHDWDSFLDSLNDAEPLDPVTLAIDSVEAARFAVSQAQAAELRALARAWELARAELGRTPVQVTSS